MSATDQRTPAGGAPRSDPSTLFDRLRALFGYEGATAREDVQEAIEEASKDGDFSEKETLILRNVLNLHELRVADVLVPRADIIAVEIGQTLAEVLTVFRTASHSRLPVYADTLDDPRGMVHILDFVDFIAKSAEARRRPARTSPEAAAGDEAIKGVARDMGLDLTKPLSEANILRPVLFAPPSMPALDLLARMQASRTHMALVVDEYGGTDGLVSIEDIMEMIVGDIEDEHDEDESHKVEIAGDGAFVMNARASLEAVALAAGEPIVEAGAHEDVETIGGLITAIAGRVPARGEIIALSATMEAEIIDADPRKVKRLKLRRVPPASGPER